MDNFLRGFTDELVKLAAFPQQSADATVYDAGVAETMEQTQGSKAKTGLSGGPIQTPPAEKKRAPTPLTSPNKMINYASKPGGEG